MAARYQLALVLLLALALLGATLAWPATPAHVLLPRGPRGVAAVVDGQAVPRALYRRELGIYRVTLPGPRAGRPREAAAEDHALRQAVAATIIAVTAARWGLVATPAAVRAEFARMRKEAGGEQALAAIARAEGLRRADLWDMARTAVLDDLLRRRSGDPHLVDRLYSRARVTYDVGPQAGQRGLAPAPRVGHPAPELAATTLADRPMALSDLRGAPVVLTMWATTCTWCRVEMPLLERFARAHPGVHVIALDVGEDRATVAAYARALGLQLPIWLDPTADAASAYGLSGLPATFAIDSGGVVRTVAIGALVGRQLGGISRQLRTDR